MQRDKEGVTLGDNRRSESPNTYGDRERTISIKSNAIYPFTAIVGQDKMIFFKKTDTGNRI